MDSASPESASFNNKTKAKNMLFLPVFITCSHLTKNRWGRGTAHSIPEPARGRGHLVIRHSGFSSPREKGCLSSCHSLLPFETGNQSGVSHLPSALYYQTGSLARYLKMPVIQEGGEGFAGLVSRRAFMFRTGHYLAQLSAIYWKVARGREMREAQKSVRHARSFGRSHASRQNHIPKHS